MVHVEFAAMTELPRITDEPPLIAVNEAELPQFDNVDETGLARTTLDGSSSISDACVRAIVGSSFLIRIVNALICPTSMVLGEKLLFNVGARTISTCRVALAGVLLVTGPNSPDEVNEFAGIVLIRLPGVVEVTSIDTVHEPGVPTASGTVPPLNDKVVPPGTAVTEPPHVFDTFAGLAMKMPGCTPTKLSVQLALVNGKSFGLNMVTARRDVFPDSMESGAKLLFIAAGKDKP